MLCYFCHCEIGDEPKSIIEFKGKKVFSHQSCHANSEKIKVRGWVFYRDVLKFDDQIHIVKELHSSSIRTDVGWSKLIEVRLATEEEIKQKKRMYF